MRNSLIGLVSIINPQVRNASSIYFSIHTLQYNELELSVNYISTHDRIDELNDKL